LLWREYLQVQWVLVIENLLQKVGDGGQPSLSGKLRMGELQAQEVFVLG
jgi:hypothetical protein